MGTVDHFVVHFTTESTSQNSTDKKLQNTVKDKPQDFATCLQKFAHTTDMDKGEPLIAAP